MRKCSFLSRPGLAGLLLLFAQTLHGAIAPSDIQRIVRANRSALQSLDTTIVRRPGGDRSAFSRERWVVLGTKFRYERYAGPLSSENRSGAERMEEARASDGSVETAARYEARQGTVSRSMPPPDSGIISQPWRLFGVEGVGIGDPLLWLQSTGTIVQTLANGSVRVMVPGQTRQMMLGHSEIPHREYQGRIVLFDLQRGGVVLSVEDTDEDGNLVLRAQSRDLVRMDSGAWIPQQTILEKYADGHLIRKTALVVEKCATITDDPTGRLFSIGFPTNFTIENNIIGLTQLPGGDPSVRSIEDRLQQMPIQYSLHPLSQKMAPPRVSSDRRAVINPSPTPLLTRPSREGPATTSETTHRGRQHHWKVALIVLLGFGGGGTLWFLRKSA